MKVTVDITVGAHDAVIADTHSFAKMCAQANRASLAYGHPPTSVTARRHRSEIIE